MADNENDEGKNNYGQYGGRAFRALSIELGKTCNYEVHRANTLISKMNGSGTKFNYHDESEYKKDISAVGKSMRLFQRTMNGVYSQKPVKIKKIKADYENYCYDLAMLEAVNAKWETVVSSNFIKKVIATIKIFLIFRNKIAAAGRDIEKKRIKLQKALKKAEKSKTKSYIKFGLSLALDALIIVSPQVRALSAISKFAVGGMIDIGSNMLLGEPKDFVGTTVGLTRSAAELEYAARGLSAGAKALGLAGKAMKIDGLVGSVKDIKKARAEVANIKKKIASLRLALKAREKFLRKTAASVKKAEAVLVRLLRKLQSQAAAADVAAKNFRKWKALRDRT